MQQPARVIPALLQSQRAMPSNYNASLRLAQMEQDAKRHDDAIADCDRGLAQSPGPLARSWLLRVKADSLLALNERAAARAALDEALKSAESIGANRSREINIAAIRKEITAMDQTR
jgi:tetratricopeptide (TPR) repeat protein